MMHKAMCIAVAASRERMRWTQRKLAGKHGHPNLAAIFRATPAGAALAPILNLWRPPQE
jgi:hypothetical protein